VKDELRKGFSFGSLGITLGVVVAIISVVWVTMLRLSGKDDRSGDGITWVG